MKEPKARVLLSLLLLASLLTAGIYAQGADLTLDGALGVYNARWLNGTDMAITGTCYVDDIQGLTGVPVSFGGLWVQDNATVFQDSSANSYVEGMVGYDSVEGALYFYNDEPDITLQIGQEEYMKVRNVGSEIVDGKVVYISGATGQSPTIDLAKSDSLETSQLIGVTTHTIGAGEWGYVTVSGIVRGIDTSHGATIGDGDIVYLSNSIAGEFTSTRPSSPNYTYAVGVVAYAHSVNGKLLVSPQFLGDVSFIVDAVGNYQSSFVADNAMVRSNGTGLYVQSTGIRIDDSDNLYPATNNTGSVGQDSLRFADGYFVTVSAYVSVTGKIIESELRANPDEVFEEGMLVKILDGLYFTKSTEELENVIGVVTYNPSDNSTALCVFGRAKVLISETVHVNDVLVSSSIDGRARPLRTVMPELNEQFEALEMSWENVLKAIEALNYKEVGTVAEDSTGDYCWAMVGY